MRWLLALVVACAGCGMPVEEKTGLAGLFTNAAETQVPPGTLLEAENVVMRRPGCIEPRDGLQLVQTLASGFAAYGFSWRSKDFILRNNGSHVFNWTDTAGATYRFDDPATGSTVDPQPLRRDIFSHAEARASLYVPCSLGVVKMESDAGPWKMAGLPHSIVFDDAFPVSSSYGSWLPNNEQAGYRAVIVNTDANRLVQRSKPTGVVVIDNTTGSAGGVTIRIVVLGGTRFDWTFVELYRTRNFPIANVVDDEMQLVATIAKASFSNFSGNFLCDLVDSVAVAERGATIYTAPSRGGLDEQNERPPAAALTALFRGSTFYANVRGPRRIKVSARFLGTISTAAGIGTRLATADRSSGSNQLLNVTPTTGLEKGMYVNVGGLAAHITAISGSTVTINVNASSTLVGGSYVFIDAVKLSGEWVPIGNLTGYTPNPLLQIYGSSVWDVLSQSIYPPEGGYTNTFVFEGLSRDTTAQTIQATHGSEYNPPLPNYDGTPLALTQDTWPGGIAWSKTDEPEHVRPLDYLFVGDQNKAILALKATRDALLILKEDGAFRLTGAGGVWRLDPIDPTARIVLPSSARELRGRVVFLGDRGVAALGEDGVPELVSAPINDQVKLVIAQILGDFPATGFYELPGMAGGNASCVFARESEYTLARGGQASSPAPLVYNDITGAWTTLAYYGHASESLSYKALFNFERLGNCVLSLGTQYYKTILSTDAGTPYLRYDRATAVTVNSYSAPNATLSAAINALEDDVIKDSAGRYWRITAVVNNSTTVPVVLGGGSAAMATGAATLYRSLRCSVIATGFAQPLSAQKQRGPFSTTWTKFVGPVRLRYGYQSSESAVWVDEDANTTLPKSGGVGNGFASYELGVSPVAKTVPTASKRAWLLRVRIRWAQAHGYAQLEGIHNELVPMQPGAPQQVVQS